MIKSVKKLLAILVFLISCSHVFAVDYDLHFYKAFLTEDIQRWEELLNEMDQNYKTNSKDSLLRKIVKARFGLINLYNRIKEEDKAGDELKILEKNIETLLDKYPEDACLWANRTALIGMYINLKPYKVMFYGPLSLDYISKARALNKNLPEVMIEYGNVKYNAPSFAGGDKDLGRRLYRDAIAKMVADLDTYKNDWFFLMVHINYANILKVEGKKKEALQLYEWLLKYEPDYKLLSDKLIPEIKKELNLN